ncbi:transcription termination factor MTERF6, chloroplastic/mitochondrial isoform X2 [Solanum pennellii]|uniref:Transcription termination factor MTERF6, chloroplastic/mitochondrial isoform X2 n=1 Tax=Solanum pennellii TaxID=28526 RepID=A0ABM1GFF7_SOLPN|nr:transcription termination factor MTERF6, chloroplastic/mitochondrial isoform X2 [Solanum pennellii]
MSSHCLLSNLSFAVPNSKPQLFPIPFSCHCNTFFYCNLIRPEQVCHKLRSYAPLVPLAARSSSSKRTEDTEEVIAEAREAVSYYLQELGVSHKESIEVALNSPNYVSMLIDSVRELDEFSLWNSTDFEKAYDPVPAIPPFKSKVYLMAKQKGDKGMLPFLESIGLTLSSATHLARYLSSNSLFQTLPTLINKVKYVKKIFFANSDDGGHIARNARQMMMHLSISIDEDVQQTLSFFEKIQARRGGLHLLGSQDASFRHLIESFPRLLLLPKESHMKRLMVFLDDIGVVEGCKRQILLLFPPIIFYDIEKDVRPRLQAILKDGLEAKDFGQMLLKYPWILSRSILQNYENILIFFDDEKIVCFLRDLGLDDDIIGRILGRCPEIFASSIGRTLKRKLNFLMGIGVSRSHLPRIIRKYPEFFVCDIHRALRPRMMYLMHVGLSKREVALMVCRFSPLLGYSIDEVLKPKVEFLMNSMGKPISDVVEYPRYFSYSLEKKIKPRYWVLNDRNLECSLKSMLGKNDEEFAAEFGKGKMLVPPL